MTEKMNIPLSPDDLEDMLQFTKRLSRVVNTSRHLVDPQKAARVLISEAIFILLVNVSEEGKEKEFIESHLPPCVEVAFIEACKRYNSFQENLKAKKDD